MTTDTRRACGILPWTTLAVGKIKANPEDFQVREITGNRQVADTGGIVVPIVKKHDFSRLSQTTGPVAIIAMTKQGVPSPKALDIIAGAAGINPWEVRIGGQKDSRAVTAQLINVPADCITTLQEHLDELRNVWLQFIGWSDEPPMSFGSIDGNRFAIKVYLDMTCNTDEVDTRLERVKERGFWNFFGVQRFALPRALQAPAGRLMALGRFDEAANLFCFDETDEPEDMAQKRREAKELAMRGDFAGALQVISGDGRFNGEITFLRSRNKFANWEEALCNYESVARRRTEFFIQSWRSLVWNQALSAAIRLKTGGNIDRVPSWLELPSPGNKKHYSALGIGTLPESDICPDVRGFFRRVKRDTVVVPRNMNWQWMDSSTILVQFDLPTGVYATMLLEHVFDIR